MHVFINLQCCCKVDTNSDHGQSLWFNDIICYVAPVNVYITGLLIQVLFPLQQLDLGRYVLHQQEQPPVYDCYAVSNHYGGLGGGHYTAFAQMCNDKKWYCFDDSRVEEISPDGVGVYACGRSSANMNRLD